MRMMINDIDVPARQFSYDIGVDEEDAASGPVTGGRTGQASWERRAMATSWRPSVSRAELHGQRAGAPVSSRARPSRRASWEMGEEKPRRAGALAGRRCHDTRRAAQAVEGGRGHGKGDGRPSREERGGQCHGEQARGNGSRRWGREMETQGRRTWPP
jgi:hypothetical protein